LITASGQMKGSPKSVSWEALALLRFFLAWIVLSQHLTSVTDHSGWVEALSSFDGKAAVVGFLLVSGYSIAASLDRESEGFYRRRFLRVYPLYFFAIVFAVALEAWTKGHVPWVRAAGNLLL